MRTNETGEYEVVVGNPQLATAFGVVVLLCAAAFFMGYEVGQNTPRGGKADSAAVGAQPAQVAALPTSAPAANAAPQTETLAPSQNGDTAATEAPPQPTTQPAHEGPAQAAPPPPAPAQPPHAPAAAQVAAMPPGSYCQAMAVRQASDAQSLLQTLKDGGMPASLQTGSDGWVRVMVGPYEDRAALSHAKTELETRFQIRGPICK